MMTSDNKTHVKPRYIIIGCNIDNPYREFNLKQMTKEEAVSMCEDRDKLVGAIVKGHHITIFEVGIWYLKEYEFIFGEEFEYSGNSLDYIHVDPAKPMLTVIHIIKDPTQSTQYNRYHCIDTDGTEYMLSSMELVRYNLTNVRVYIEEGHRHPNDNPNIHPQIKVETIGSKIPEYTISQLNDITAEADEEDKSEFKALQKKVMQLDQIIGLYKDFDIDWNTQTLLASRATNEELDIPEKFPPVKFIGPEVMLEVHAEKLEIPDIIEAIGELSFSGSSIKELVIGPSLKRIGEDAFESITIEKLTLNCREDIALETSLGCSWRNLKEINIGPEVNHIERFLETSGYEHAYHGVFHWLQSINVSPENPYYTSIDGVLYNKDVTKLLHFPHCLRLEHYVMPDTVKEIKEIISPDEGPFQNRKILKSVKLSDGLTSLPLQAFAGAESLEYVDLGKGIKEIKEFESLCTESLKIVRFYDNLHLDVKALHTSFEKENNKVYFLTAFEGEEPEYSIKGSFEFSYIHPVFVHMPIRESYKQRVPFYYKPARVISREDYSYFDKYIFNRPGTMKEMEEACKNN